jgi:hypothetical protein
LFEQAARFGVIAGNAFDGQIEQAGCLACRTKPPAGSAAQACSAAANMGRPGFVSAGPRRSRRTTSLKMLWHWGHSYFSISCRFLTGVTSVSFLSMSHAMHMGSAYMAADPFWGWESDAQL